MTYDYAREIHEAREHAERHNDFDGPDPGDYMDPPPTANVPVPFTGTREQREANVASHYWINDGDEILCSECESKPWHAGAAYQCGASIPRMEVDAEDAREAQIMAVSTWAATRERMGL